MFRALCPSACEFQKFATVSRADNLPANRILQTLAVEVHGPARYQDLSIGTYIASTSYLTLDDWPWLSPRSTLRSSSSVFTSHPLIANTIGHTQLPMSKRDEKAATISVAGSTATPTYKVTAPIEVNTSMLLIN